MRPKKKQTSPSGVVVSPRSYVNVGTPINVTGIKTPSSSSRPSTKHSDKTPQDPEVIKSEKERLERLMPLIENLGEQALQRVLGKLETIDVRAAASELNEIADAVVDQGELVIFEKTLKNSKMYEAEQNLNHTSGDFWQNKLTELREKEPSIAEQILQFKIKKSPALRTLHQAIQRSEWLNIVFNPVPATRAVGAERKRLHADICEQEADAKRKFDIGVTQATPESEMLSSLIRREAEAVRAKLESLHVTKATERDNLVGTTLTLTYRAMVKESEKDRTHEEEERRARIEARREELRGEVDSARSNDLVLERSQAAVKFVRSFEIGGERDQITRKKGAKKDLRDLNRVIEEEFIRKQVSNFHPALVLKDFSEEMSDPLLTPIFQAYAITKWLELRYKSEGPVTRDAAFKEMEDLISQKPFPDLDDLDQDDLLELEALQHDYNSHTQRVFDAVSLQACQNQRISAASKLKMMLPVTNLLLVTSKIEAKEKARVKKVLRQKRQDEEAEARKAYKEQRDKYRLDEALEQSKKSLQTVIDHLLTLKNDFKQGLELRQELFPEDTGDGMLKDLNAEIESVDENASLTTRTTLSPSPRREELLGPTIYTTLADRFLKPSMSYQELEEIREKLEDTRILLQERIERLRRLESERKDALKDAVESLKKVHAKLVTLRKPPYNKGEQHRKTLMDGVVSGKDEDLQPVFENINRDDVLGLNFSQVDEANLDLGSFNAEQLRKIVEAANLVEEALKGKIDLIEEARKYDLEKETTKALKKLNEVIIKFKELKDDPFVLESKVIEDIYSPSFETSDPQTLRVLFRNTLDNEEPELDESLGIVEKQDSKTPHESKIAFLKKAQEKSDEIIQRLNVEIQRLKDELDVLMREAADEMAPLHEKKQLLKNLGVTDENLLDDALRDLTGRHGPSVEAVLSFYKEADLDKDRTEQAVKTLKEAVDKRRSFVTKKTLLKQITPTLKAAFEKLESELERARKEIDRKRNEELDEREREAINALNDVRAKLSDLKNNHAIGSSERGALMTAKLDGPEDLTLIFTEINTNVGELGQPEVDQNLKNVVDRQLVGSAADGYERKIKFLEEIKAKAKEVEAALVADIESKLNAEQVARRQELERSRGGLISDFNKIREKLKTLKTHYQESVAQRGELYSDLELQSPTLISILENINGNVGEPGAEGVVVDDVAGILDKKIEAEKRKKPDTEELLQHQGAMKWIDKTKTKTADVYKVLQDEIDLKFREAEEKLERQRELRAEKEREDQIKEAGEIFETSFENAVDALSRVHGRLNRLRNAPHGLLPQDREKLFLPTLSTANLNVSSVFQNVNAGVEGQESDIRSAITRYLDEARRSLDSTENSPVEHDEKMKFLTSATDYCKEVTTKAGEIEEVLKAAELEKLKDLAAASLEVLDAKKREFYGDLLKGLQTDRINAVNDAATNQVKEFYSACDPAGELAGVNAAAKASVEAALNKLGVDATFEKKAALLEAIQAKAAEALGVLEEQKRDKEAQNESIGKAVASLQVLHKEKKDLANPPSNLDELRDPNNLLALEAVKKFYQQAGDTNGTQEEIKRYITDALASQENASSTDKQKFLEAIPEIAEKAIETLKQSAEKREMEDLIKVAAESLVQIHTAKTRLAAFRTHDLNLLDDLENSDSGIAANRLALDRVKNFYRDAVVIVESEEPDVQARKSILEDQNARLEVHKAREFLKAIPPMAKLAARSLEKVAEAKEVEAAKLRQEKEGRDAQGSLEKASRSGGAMSKVDFTSFTPIIESSLIGGDKIFYPPVKDVTYSRCRPVLVGVTEAQQKMIDDKFDFVTTKSKEGLPTAEEVKSEINQIMAEANSKKANLTEKEMAIAILLAIKHGGIMSDDTDSKAVINDLRTVCGFGEEKEELKKAVTLYVKMASFAENFQKDAAAKGFLTGNYYESKYAVKHKEEVQTGLRLKRLPPNYSRDLFGDIGEWENICDKIGLTVDVLSRPVGSVSEVVSVSRPMSANSQSSSRSGFSF